MRQEQRKRPVEELIRKDGFVRCQPVDPFNWKKCTVVVSGDQSFGGVEAAVDEMIDKTGQESGTVFARISGRRGDMLVRRTGGFGPFAELCALDSLTPLLYPMSRSYAPSTMRSERFVQLRSLYPPSPRPTAIDEAAHM
jgi:hypothetical protein